MPTGQSEHRAEIQFRVGLPDGSPDGSWDSSNDYSCKGLEKGNTMVETEYITMYDGDKLIWGKEP